MPQTFQVNVLSDSIAGIRRKTSVDYEDHWRRHKEPPIVLVAVSSMENASPNLPGTQPASVHQCCMWSLVPSRELPLNGRRPKHRCRGPLPYTFSLYTSCLQASLYLTTGLAITTNSISISRTVIFAGYRRSVLLRV